MGLIDLDKAFELIDENNGDFEGKKPVSLIIQAETILGLKFPPSYFKFLETLGCGEIEGLEFYGLIDQNFQNSSIPNAIWLTLNERALGLPHNLVLISSVGEGTY